jgi:hypothetical protein
MKMRIRKIALASAGVILLTWVFWQPVWFRFETGPLQGDTRVLILNPLRNRTAEKTANALLQGLSSGHEEEVLSRVAKIDSDERTKVARRERQSPIQAWRLVYMTNTGGVRTLRYSLKTADGTFCCGAAFITLTKKKGSWSIEDYNRAY